MCYLILTNQMTTWMPSISKIGKWNIDLDTYNSLAEESEYASWLYIWGFCPNHFTISVNHLENFSSLIEVNDLLKKNNFKLNISGGEIKGSKEELLEQSSILADEMPVFFGNSKQILPSLSLIHI